MMITKKIIVDISIFLYYNHFNKSNYNFTKRGVNMKFTYNNETYFSFVNCCETHGVEKEVAYRLIKKYNEPNKVYVLDFMLFNRQLGEVIFEGVSYSSLYTFCISKCLNPFDLYEKIKGLKISKKPLDITDYVDGIKEYGKKSNRAGISVIYNGKNYITINEWAKDNDVNYASFVRYKNSHKNLSLDEVIKGYMNRGECKKGVKGNPIEYEGKIYNSLNELCRAYNISPAVLCSQREHYGMTPEEIINKYRDFETEIVYDGKHYNSINECLNALSIRKKTYTGYKDKYNLTPEESILVCLGGRSVTYRNVEYPNLKIACKRKNIRYGVVLNLIYNKGCTYERAITEAIKERNKDKRTYNTGRVEFRGKWYNSNTELFRVYNVHRNSIYDFQKRHGLDSITEALEYYLETKKKD